MTALQRPTPAPFPWAEPYFTVGVTGTNGKTSTTHLVAAVMQACGHRVLCQSTLGYFLSEEALQVERTESGFYGALQRAAERGAAHAAIEVTSLALMRGYAKKWRFDLGVFTNLSRDHVAEHGSWEAYLAAKAQLFVHLAPGATAVFNAGDGAAQLLAVATPEDVKRAWYHAPSRGPALTQPDLAAAAVELTLDGTEVQLAPSAVAEQLGGDLRLRLIGDVFAENALAAALAGLHAGLPAQGVLQGLAACAPPAGRFEIMHRDPTVVLDYAHTPDALERTLRTARRLLDSQGRGGKLRIVFGAGGGRDAPKREPMGRAAGELADHVVLCDDNPRLEAPEAIVAALAAGAQAGARARLDILHDRRNAIGHALSVASSADIVLVTGRGHDRGMHFRDRVEPYSDVDTLAALLG